MTTATTKQQELTDALAARNIDSEWNGAFLNCRLTFVRANGKKKTLRWSLRFDDPSTLDGVKAVGNINKAYVFSFARMSFFEALRIGQGDSEAAKFVRECRASGVTSGATQEFIDAH